MSATLAAIAQRAHVSQATASRVINGKPGVSEDKKQAVIEAAAALGAPISKLNQCTRLVAIITPDLTHPILAKFTTMLISLLEQRNMLAVVCSYTAGGATEADFIDRLPSQHIAAAIFLGGQFQSENVEKPFYAALVERGVPIVFINGGPRKIDAFYLGTDHGKAMKMALQHLVDLGHRNIGFLVGPRGLYSSTTKFEAAKAFCAGHGLDDPGSRTVWTPFDVESGRIGAKALLGQGVTAFVCGTDELAFGAIRAAYNMGLKVPEDVSVIGYDDSPFMCAVVPSLTTIRQPVEALSKFALEGIVAMVEGGERIEGRNMLLFEPELVVRETTGVCRNRE